MDILIANGLILFVDTKALENGEYKIAEFLNQLTERNEIDKIHSTILLSPFVAEYLFKLKHPHEPFVSTQNLIHNQQHPGIFSNQAYRELWGIEVNEYFSTYNSSNSSLQKFL